MAWRNWQDLTTAEFDAPDMAAAVALLPVAATEQHGPHLPLGTDAMIAEGLLDHARRAAPADLKVLQLPVLSVCASDEHRNFAGTLSVSTAELADRIVAVAERVRAAGLVRLVIVSSHGGNVAAMTDASLRCRADLDLLAVNLTWMRLGLPDGPVDEDERAFGVHGGLVETSLMLHFRPELVDMAVAGRFASLQETLAGSHDILRAHGPVGFGWMAEDLNPAGVVGDARAASADAGKRIADHQAARMIALLGEVAAVDPAGVRGRPSA